MSNWSLPRAAEPMGYRGGRAGVGTVPLVVTTSLQGRRAAGSEFLRSSRSTVDVKAFEVSYILSYNVVQDHEGDTSNP